MNIKNSNFAKYKKEDFFIDINKFPNIFYNHLTKLPEQVSSITKQELSNTLVFFDGCLVYDNLDDNYKIYINDLTSAMEDVPSQVIKMKEKLASISKTTIELEKALETGENGIVVVIPAGFSTNETINIFSFNSKVYKKKNYIYLEENCSVKVNHYSNTENLEFSSELTEVYLAKNSKFTFTSIAEYENTKVYSPLRVIQDESSEFYFKEISMNYKTSFSDLFVSLIGDKSKVDISKLSVNSRNTLTNANVEITHLAKNTVSNVMNQVIVNESADSTYNILSSIKKDMVKSEAYQKTVGLILSPTSYISANPILEIDCNDVQANHGASIGKFSEEDLFYLMSRGIEKVEAQKLIIEGVISPYLNNIDEDCFKNIINDYVRKCLGE